MKPKKNIKYYLLVVTAIIVGVVFFLQQQEDSNIVTMEFPPPFDTTYGAIKCNLSQLALGFDINNKLIESKRSPTFTTSPTYSLISGSGSEFVSFVANPKIFCTTTTQSNLQMVVHPSRLDLHVWALDNTGTAKRVYTTYIDTQRTEFTLGSTVGKSLGAIGIKATDITNNLPKGNYDSKVIFVFYGTLDISFVASENFKMHVVLPANQINSEFYVKITDTQTNVNLDRDGDGISNVYDQCPDQKETFNGYLDSDGCPDTVPQTPSVPTKPTAPTNVFSDEYCRYVAQYTYNISSYADYIIVEKNTPITSYSTPVININTATESKWCVNKNNISSLPPTTQTATLNGKANIYMQVRYADQQSFGAEIPVNKGTFSGQIGQIPFQELIGSADNFLARKEIAKVKANINFAMDDRTKFQRTYLKDSLVKFEPYVIMYGKRYDLTPVSGFPKQIILCTETTGALITRTSIDQSCPRYQGQTTLGSIDNLVGKRIAEIEISASDFVLKTANDLRDGDNPAKMRIDISGDIKVDYNDGQIHPLSGKFSNTYVEWDVIITKPSTNIPSVTTTPQCNENQTLVTINGISECKDKETLPPPDDPQIPQCNPDEILIKDSTGLSICSKPANNPTVTPIDTSQIEIPKYVEGKLVCSINRVVTITEGDVQCMPKGSTLNKPQLGVAGVDICQSPTKTTGFPCTQAYRNTYCQGTTQCTDFSVITGGFNPSICEGTQTTTGCVKGTGNIQQTSSTSNNGQITQAGMFNPSFITGDNTICIGQNCYNPFAVLNDQMTVFFIAGTIIIISVIIYKKKQ